MLQGKGSADYSRKPEIVADAAYAILIQDPKKVTGNYFIDDNVLKDNGVTDMDQYACNPAFKDQLMPDFFVDDDPNEAYKKFNVIKQTLETSSSSGASSDGGKVEKLFDTIQKSLNEELVKKTQAVYQFVLTGEESGKWWVKSFDNRSLSNIIFCIYIGISI